MRIITMLFVLFGLCNLNIMAQKIDYYPEQRDNVTDANYRYGMIILEETYKKIKRDGGVLNYADYWNLGIAYIVLQEDAELIRKMLYKSKATDPEAFAETFIYNDAVEFINRWKKYLTEEEYEQIRKEASEIVAKTEKAMPVSGKVAKGLEPELVNIFQKLKAQDLKYRIAGNIDMEKQRLLDEENIEVIDSLYNIYKTYIGASMVGTEYQYVMWRVIQHSNFSAMERYLPVIYYAAKAGQIKEEMLKMLLDRVYSLKCDYQIYGTQAGVPIGPIEEIDAIRKKYELQKPTDIQKLLQRDPAEFFKPKKKSHSYFRAPSERKRG